MTSYALRTIKIGEARQYTVVVNSTSLDLRTVTSFVFQIREQFTTAPVIDKEVLAVDFTTVTANELVVPIFLTSSDTAVLSPRNYLMGGECRVGSERYPVIDGKLPAAYNPVTP